MSKPSQPQRQSRPRPAGSRTGGKTPARSSGGIGLPSSRRGRLSILALLLALAALLLVPAVVFAAPSKPSKPTASSSNGVMTVTWGKTNGATAGYQYRYSTNAWCLLLDSGCDFGGSDQDWTDHGSGRDDTSVTFSAANSNALAYGQDLLLPSTRLRRHRLRRGFGFIRRRRPRRAQARQADRTIRHGGQRPGNAVLDRAARR